VTNDAFYPALSQWARERGIPDHHVVSNGTCSNESRLGGMSHVLNMSACEICHGHVSMLMSISMSLPKSI
jgi:hypothetical protein